MTVHVRVAVRRADDDRVLTVDGDLPGLESDVDWPWPVVTPIVDALRTHYDLTVNVLRAAWVGRMPGRKRVEHRLYEAEWLGGDQPAAARLLTADELARASGVPKPMRAAIRAGALSPATAAHQPWYRPGWWAETATWVDRRLADRGIRRRGPLVQVRVWARSALATFETDRGRMWVKAVPIVFAHEVAVTQLLADIDPGVAAPVVAAEMAEPRLLMEHVEGPILGDRSDPGAWTATLARIAELQRVLAQDPRTLTVAGVVRAPVSALGEQVPDLLTDDALLGLGRPGGLTRTEAARLAARTNELVAACDALATSPVPDSLDHGDLTPAQVIVGEMGPVVLDWSDGAVTHPFLTAASFLRSGESGRARGSRRPAPGALADAYLGPWLASGIGDKRGLRHVLDLARQVRPLQTAALHRRHVLPGVDQPWEVSTIVPDALRTLL